MKKTLNNTDGETEYKYKLYLTEQQAKYLAYVCNQFPRLVEGQDWAYQELFERAWEKRAKEATGDFLDRQFEGGLGKMRRQTEKLCKFIKKKYWGLTGRAYYGVNYDEHNDAIWDIYQVLRYQLWLDDDDENKSNYTVDAYPAHRFGNEPLAKIEKI